MVATVPTPVSLAGFAAALSAIAPEGSLGLAVSGGSDSLALLHLAHASGREIHALTVDHGLRAESAGEAQWVAAQCAALGVPHVTLTWGGGKPAANLQAKAREARYRLMGEWCRAKGLRGLLLAHTQDDQAETFLLRLARGSGVDGLAAMSPRTLSRGLVLLRPLLGMSRLSLRATLFARGAKWLDDPSNENPRFARVRMRVAMPPLAAEGATAARLAATAQRMARAREALDAATDALLAEAAQVDAAGFVRFASASLETKPEEIGLRALSRMLRAVGGAPYPLRLERLERLYECLRAGALGAGRTLGGCLVVPATDPGTVLILREARAVDATPLSLAPGGVSLWDGRFWVSLADGRPAFVQPLDAASALLVPELVGARLPARVRSSLPSLWLDGRPVAVPHLAYLDPRSGLRPESFRAAFAGL